MPEEEKDPIKEALLKCYLEGCGLRVSLKAGGSIDLVPGSLNIVGVADGFSGYTSEDEYRKVLLEDVDSLVPFE